jgi:hypothetical protein
MNNSCDDSLTTPSRDISPQTDRSSATSHTWVMDQATFVILFVATAVSFYLTSLGARELFDGRAILGDAFALVVQATAFLALWELPKHRLTIKGLLLLGWFVATLFSVGASYDASYASNSAEDVAYLTQDVDRFLGNIGARIDEDQRQATLAEMRASAEGEQGTYSTGRPGAGGTYRKLRQEAIEARVKAETSAAYRPVLEQAHAALNAPRLTTAQVRDIYNGVVVTVGRYAGDVPELRFDQDLQGLASRVYVAYSIALGVKPETAPHQRIRVIGTLSAAASMELLGLIISLIRVAAHSRTHRRSVAEVTAELMVGILSLARIPSAVRDALRQQETHWKRQLATEHPDTRPAAIERTHEASSQSVKSLWTEAIHGQAMMLKVKKGADTQERIIRVLTHLMPDDSTLKSRSRTERGQPCAPSAPFFNKALFAHKKVVLNIAHQTKVVAVTPDAELTAGEKWNDWVLFLIEMHADLTRAAPPATRPTLPHLQAVADDIKPRTGVLALRRSRR